MRLQTPLNTLRNSAGRRRRAEVCDGWSTMQAPPFFFSEKSILVSSSSSAMSSVPTEAHGKEVGSRE